jgi:hypothetical protein
MKHKKNYFFFLALFTYSASSQSLQMGLGQPLHRFVDASESYGKMAQEGIIPIDAIGNERRLAPLKQLFAEKLPFKTFFSGYLKTAFYYDTRQVNGFADDYVLFFPEQRKLSACNRDINARGQVDIIPLESRLIWYIFGPNVNNAHTRAKISTDFIEDFEFEFDEFFHKLRLREAYFVLAWKHTAFLIGQEWHPMSYPIVSPNTVSFNTGSPILPSSRNPQIRFIYHHPKCELWFTVLSQADFKSNGPEGFSTNYARNSLVPNVNVLTKLFVSEKLTLGIDIDYKRLVPRLQTNKNFKTTRAIGSVGFGSWLEYITDPLEIFAKASYIQNGQPYGVLGAYAVHCVNPITDRREYTNYRSAAGWAEVIIKKQIEPAFFIGYIKNLGANKTIISQIIDDNGVIENTNYTVFARLDSVFRFSPRARYYIEPFVVESEIEYTRAIYGTPDPKGKIQKTEPAVYNVRVILALSYFF